MLPRADDPPPLHPDPMELRGLWRMAEPMCEAETPRTLGTLPMCRIRESNRNISLPLLLATAPQECDDMTSQGCCEAVKGKVLCWLCQFGFS